MTLVVGGQKAIIPYLVESFWQDVLEETAEELQCIEGHGFPAVILGIFVAEGDILLIDGDDSVIGDSDSVDVSGKVAKDFVCALRRRLTVNYPFSFPDGFRKDLTGQCFLGHMHEFSAKEY